MLLSHWLAKNGVCLTCLPPSALRGYSITWRSRHLTLRLSSLGSFRQKKLSTFNHLKCLTSYKLVFWIRWCSGWAIATSKETYPPLNARRPTNHSFLFNWRLSYPLFPLIALSSRRRLSFLATWETLEKVDENANLTVQRVAKNSTFEIL